MEASASPVRWLSDNEYRVSRLSERAVAWAASQVGVRERGWNRGLEVEGYQEAAGLGSGGGFAWCACFVAWCLLRAGAEWRELPKRGECAAVAKWRAWAKDKGLERSEPARGRLFFWLDRSGFGHIGFCLGPPVFGVFRTIEGNTDSGAGSREGDGVHRRFRTVSFLRRQSRWGFIEIVGGSIV